MNSPLDSTVDEGMAPQDGSAPTPTISAEWVVEQHRLQQEVNAQQAANTNRIMQMLEQLGANQPQRAVPPQAAATIAPVAAMPPQVNVDYEPRKARHSLGHPEKFDGEDKTKYPPFKGFLIAKLQIDQPAIGGETEQVWYAYGRLSGKAAARVFPWLEASQRTGQALLIDSFMEQMDAAFYDPQIAQRALEWVNTHKQGSTPFRDFLQTFEQKLLEAGGWDFSDKIRKNYLKAALSVEIKQELVAQTEPVTYSEYVALIRRTADNMDELKRIKKVRSGGWTSSNTNRQGSTQSEAMDWEPTSRTAAGKAPERKNDNRPRAKWVSQDVLESRKTNRECLRCGGDDHYIDKCRYSPPKRPARSTASASTTPPPSQHTTKSAGKGPTKGKKVRAPPLPKVEELSTSDEESSDGSSSEN